MYNPLTDLYNAARTEGYKFDVMVGSAKQFWTVGNIVMQLHHFFT